MCNMGAQQNRFSLRRLFAVIAGIACVVGAYIGFARARGDAEREAIRSAIRAGRIDPEEYRDMLGDEVDALRPTKPD